MKFLRTLSFLSLILVGFTVSPGCGNKVPQKTPSELFTSIKDKDEAVRISAARDLGKVTGGDVPNAIRALIEALKDDSAYVRKTAVMSLGTHGANARDAVPSLQIALKDSDEGVRLEAQDALKKIQ